MTGLFQLHSFVFAWALQAAHHVSQALLEDAGTVISRGIEEVALARAESPVSAHAATCWVVMRELFRVSALFVQSLFARELRSYGGDTPAADAAFKIKVYLWPGGIAIVFGDVFRLGNHSWTI